MAGANYRVILSRARDLAMVEEDSEANINLNPQARLSRIPAIPQTLRQTFPTPPVKLLRGFPEEFRICSRRTRAAPHIVSS
jgi:hypothetical protein